MQTNVPFRQFVDACGSQAAAARALNRSRATVNRVYHGHMPVSLQVARRVEAITHGQLTVSALLGLRVYRTDMVEGAADSATVAQKETD